MKLRFIPGIMAAILFGAAPLFTSCSDEDLAVPQSSSRMTFMASISDGWECPDASRCSPDSSWQLHAVETIPGSDLFLISHADRDVDKTLFDAPAPSRGAQVDDASFYSSFSLFAVMDRDGATSPYITNDVIAKTGNAWASSAPRYWPGAGCTLRFTAYAPCDAGSVSADEIAYSVPADVADQADLLVATAEVAGDHDAPVDLQFRHVCTAIRVFAAADMKGTVTGVALRNIQSTGVYRPATADWTLDPSLSDFEIPTNVVLPSAAGPAGLADKDDTFMMLPQTLADDALLEVTLDDGTVLSAKIKPLVAWLPGTVVTYTVSHTSVTYSLEIRNFDGYNFEPSILSGWGGTTSAFYVYSQMTDSHGVVTHVPWDAYSVAEDGVTPLPFPDFLSMDTSDGGYDGSHQRYATMTAQTDFKLVSKHNDRLQNAAERGTADNPYNLAGSPANTANCYIVNAAGHYCLPLVYGNAVKNGKKNERAYKTDVKSGLTSRPVLNVFLNHLDNEITSPYIYENSGCNPAGAKLVWQDVDGLLTDIHLTDDCHSLAFAVNKSTLAQGNAVVAVTDDAGTVMWSWHIWVTDYVPLLPPEIDFGDGGDENPERDNRIVNRDGQEFILMGANLGWCEREKYVAESRTVRVLFKQRVDNGCSLLLNFTQSAAVKNSYGDQPYYQWGRKDPVQPPNFDINNNAAAKTLYPLPEPYKIVADRTVSIGEAIQHPENFYYDANGHIEHNWLSQTIDGVQYTNFMNLWNIDNIVWVMNDDNVKTLKTIYDPCPAGYCVPPQQIFNTFTQECGVVATQTKNEEGWIRRVTEGTVNTPMSTVNEVRESRGWVFYCKAMSADGEKDPSLGQVFIPLSGWHCAQSTGAYPYAIGQGGSYRSNLPDAGLKGRTGWAFNVSPYGIVPYAFSNQAEGLAIRPIREPDN